LTTRSKGGVEGDIGWFRRNHLVPVPEVNSLAELNQLVQRWDAEDDARRIGTRPRTVAEHFAVEQPLLKPLPDEGFETGLQLGLRVDRYAQITVRTNRYSVPARLIGRRVRVLLGASELVVYDRHAEVARHERLIAKAGVRLELDHYLEALVRNPARCQGRPRWNRPARPARSPRPMTPGGRRRARPTVTATAPAP
jgi:hypothetical protein